MKLTIRKKILLCSLVPLLLLGAIIIILASTLVRSSIIDQVKNSLKGTSIATLAAYDQNAGSYLEAENGDIWKGSLQYLAIRKSCRHDQKRIWNGSHFLLWFQTYYDLCT